MGLQCGIVGLPNVGKSTLFNALSNGNAQAANYPFCTIEPNVGVITVPDPRLFTLHELVKPQSLVPAVVEFVDIAGLVKGASKGEGLGNQFLANIREVDAIAHVVRCFEDENVSHVSGKLDPVSDKEVIDAELQIKDLDSIDKRLKKTEKQAQLGDGKSKKELESLIRAKDWLEKGQNLRSMPMNESENLLLKKDLQLLTIKPVIYVANVHENALGNNKYVDELEKSVYGENAGLIILSAALESQLSQLDEEEKKLFMKEYGIKESGLDQLVHQAYRILDLITFFTVGEKEVRAWTIKNGSRAPQAAGAIHTDFERGFIRAEVIKYEEFIKYKSELACKEAGKMFIEGKEYLVKDGDLMHFRFNV